MRSHGVSRRAPRGWPRIPSATAIALGIWLAAALPAAARPRLGAELALQHAREDTDGAVDPEGFPISGAGTATLSWPVARRLDVRAGIGYEDRGMRGRAAVATSSGSTSSARMEHQSRSLVLPLHAGFALGSRLRIEAGPEWRWLLQSRTRVRELSPGAAPALGPAGPGIANSTIFEQSGTAGRWRVDTDDFVRTSLAFSAGAGAHVPLRGGEACVLVRWVEVLGNQRQANTLAIPSHVRMFQLALSWER